MAWVCRHLLGVLTMVLLTAELISLKMASERLPNRPSHSTIWRWATHGIHGRKLETVRIGGYLFTSQQALDSFIRELNEGAK